MADSVLPTLLLRRQVCGTSIERPFRPGPVDRRLAQPPLQKVAANSLQELNDEGVLVGLAVAFLDGTDDRVDQPGNPDDGIEGKKDKPNH